MQGPLFVELKPSERTPDNIGAKAESLLFLARSGARIPPTLVCPWDAHLAYRAGRTEVVDALRAELATRVDRDRRYAVRSSANLEDGASHSFAGQFGTHLDVQGPEAILEAIRLVWESAAAASVGAYLRKAPGLQEGETPQVDGIRMAVILQPMVTPHISGVAFSRNPVNGRDEVVVEAVRGRGDALLQGGVTPLRWINRRGEWVAPAADPVGEIPVIGQVVREAKRLASACGAPADLEWVFDGRELYWVQLRKITTGAVDVYSRRIAAELFPGLIKPLVWSTSQLVNRAWKRLLGEFVGPIGLDTGRMTRLLYHRAYFNVSLFGEVFDALGMPRESLELLMGLGGDEKPRFKPTARTYRLAPRLARAALPKTRFDRQVAAYLPELRRQYATFRAEEAEAMSEAGLLVEVGRLEALMGEVAYYNIVVPLLMQLYGALLARSLALSGVDPADLDVTAGMEEIRDYTPNDRLSTLRRLYDDLGPDQQAVVRAADPSRLSVTPGLEAFEREFAGLMAAFGHLSDNGNDYSVAPWRETPELVLRMVPGYEPRSSATRSRPWQEIHLSRARRSVLRPLYQKARALRYCREAISFEYTYGYGLFRPYFLALGSCLARRGVLGERHDVFFLTLEELREVVSEAQPSRDYPSLVSGRRQEMEHCRRISPPVVIYGEEEVTPHPASASVLQGTATSRGRYTGPVRIIQGIADFGKLRRGDVLVIPYSDVGWSPLFALAGAVIAESGGMLSHSSIVAREFSIPAVVSVAGATRLADATVVTVDGYAGAVIVHEAAQVAPALPPEEDPWNR